MRFVLVVLFFLGSLCCRAHQVAAVELEFLKTEEQWRLLGEMDIAYMLPETRNIPGGLPMKRSEVMKSSPEEFARIRKETENTLRKLLRITFAGKDIAWRVDFPDFDKEPFALPEEAGDIALLSTRMIVDSVREAGELKIHWEGEQETELIILVEEGDEPRIVSTRKGGAIELLKQDATQQALPTERNISDGWVQSGFAHVLPLGYDHVLFILGLFLLAPRWKPLLTQSLLFTLAHTITLGLAIYGVVNLPSKWVEVIIALSIAWIGIENLFVKELGKRRVIFVFLFGLLHGLGFAGVLSEKLEGIPRDKLAWPLLGFNVGVELGQIAVLLVAFILFWPLRKWEKEGKQWEDQARKWGSIAIALAGLYWAGERMRG